MKHIKSFKLFESYDEDLDFLNDVNKVKGIYENFDNGS